MCISMCFKYIDREKMSKKKHNSNMKRKTSNIVHQKLKGMNYQTEKELLIYGITKELKALDQTLGLKVSTSKRFH